MPKKIPSILRPRSRPASALPASPMLGGGGTGWWGGPMTQAGVMITPDTALNYAAVFAAMFCISTDCAILPTCVYERSGDAKRLITDHPIVELYQVEPNDEVDAIHSVQVWIKDALGRGNGYQQIVREGGYPVALYRLPPEDVTPTRDKAGRLLYKLSNGIQLPAEDVLHLKGFSSDGINGMSVVGRAKQTIGLGTSAEISAAGMFGQGVNVSGMLKSSKNLDSTAQANLRQSLIDQYGGPYNAGGPGVLVGDYEWMQMGLNPSDGQFLATRAFNVIEICRWFNLNPIKLMDFSNGRFSNIEQAQLDYITTTLMPWLTFMEVEMNRKLLSRDDRKLLVIRHDVDARLRGDSAARWSNYDKAFKIGTMTQNEIRGREDMNPMPGADKLYLPVNNMAATATAGDDASPTTPAADTPNPVPKPAGPDPIRDPLKIEADRKRSELLALDQAIEVMV